MQLCVWIRSRRATSCPCPLNVIYAASVCRRPSGRLSVALSANTKTAKARRRTASGGLSLASSMLPLSRDDGGVGGDGDAALERLKHTLSMMRVPVLAPPVGSDCIGGLAFWWGPVHVRLAVVGRPLLSTAGKVGRGFFSPKNDPHQTRAGTSGVCVVELPLGCEASEASLAWRRRAKRDAAI